MYFFTLTKTYIILHPSIHSFTHLRKRIELLLCTRPHAGEQRHKVDADRLSRSELVRETVKRKERVETNINTNGKDCDHTGSREHTGDGVSQSMKGPEVRSKSRYESAGFGEVSQAEEARGARAWR